MKNSRVKTIVYWALALAPVLLTGLVYGNLPDQIPLHWGIDGQVSYGSKWQLWMVSGMSPLFGALFLLLPKIDPRTQNYKKFQGVYDSFCYVMFVFLLAMTGVVISETFYPGRISVGIVVTVMIGLLFIFFGNMMPKMKSNYFMGIKTPWTLSDTTVWNKTHRLAGKLWFAGGLAIAAGAFFIKEDSLLFGLMMAIIFVVSVIPVVCSYLWYRQLHPKGE